MLSVRDNEWTAHSETYAPSQVEAVLKDLGLEIKQETPHDFLSYCPYHGNNNSPAFSTSKTLGYSICFNPSCSVGLEKRLTLEKLVMDLKGFTNKFKAVRFIHARKGSVGQTLEERIAEIAARPEEFVEFSPETIENAKKNFWSNQMAIDYMVDVRGFSKETLRKFNIGYSAKKGLIMVPMYDPKGMPIGVIGRSPSQENKVFKNSYQLPKSKTIWNLHQARRYESIIITEASFDSMSIDQAGYPNTGALLGGSLSLEQEAYIRRHFNKVIIMTDNDEKAYYTNCRKCMRKGFEICDGHQPGRDLGLKIAERLKSDIRVSWAAYSDTEIYPRGMKDANSMTGDEIRQALRNAIPHHEYLDWQVK